jgi:cell division protein FtsW
VICGAALFAFLVAYNPVRLARILVFLGPEASQHGSGWQVWQSVLDIGGGGPMGNFLHGSIHKYGFVPEQQTDFIFATIGQETGFWGTSLVVMLYLGIFLCGLHIMKHARDRFGYYLAAGCTTLIVLQAFINIAVATSLVPNKGLPLPFISCGGSSLLSMFVCVGLLAGVGIHSGELVNLFRSPRRVTPAAVQLVLL